MSSASKKVKAANILKKLSNHVTYSGDPITEIAQKIFEKKQKEEKKEKEEQKQKKEPDHADNGEDDGGAYYKLTFEEKVHKWTIFFAGFSPAYWAWEAKKYYRDHPGREDRHTTLEWLEHYSTWSNRSWATAQVKKEIKKFERETAKYEADLVKYGVDLEKYLEKKSVAEVEAKHLEKKPDGPKVSFKRKVSPKIYVTELSKAAAEENEEDEEEDNADKPIRPCRM
jgi:hypothetical protein